MPEMTATIEARGKKTQKHFWSSLKIRSNWRVTFELRPTTIRIRGSNNHGPDPWWSLFIFTKELKKFGLEVGELSKV